MREDSGKMGMASWESGPRPPPLHNRALGLATSPATAAELARLGRNASTKCAVAGWRLLGANTSPRATRRNHRRGNGLRSCLRIERVP
jgi:hypothetical protein